MSPKPNMWVDVGGTFTDAILCSLAPQGEGITYQSLKVLSSGRTRVSILAQPQPRRFVLQGIPGHCRNFWVSAKLSIAIPNSPTFTASIVASETDWLEIDADLAQPLFKNLKENPVPAEILCGLESPILAAHRLLDIPIALPLPPLDVRLGTTRGTNALLTRTGAEVGLCITRGFADIPYIGNQDRPDLFALHVVKAPPLCRHIVEVHERIDAQGNVLVPLDTQGLRETFATWKAAGIRAIAVVLMHSYRAPQHEMEVAAIAREFSFEEILCSSNISPVRKLLSRCDTALVDAYLSPVVNDYLRTVREQFENTDKSRIQIMTSSGSLVDLSEFRGKDSVLSGPAGGIVAVQELLQQTDMQAALAFDMGGTSTDVSRCTREELPLQYDTFKAGVRIVTPILSIHTVAAGGGSICSFDGVQLHVGPASAGSYPGPACYGQGGPLTITDINLLLGIIPEHALPFPVDRKAAEAQLHQLAAQIRASQGISITDFDIAHGFRQLANQMMADAIRVISTRQGADPREHILVGFGGAAGQHHCDLAEALEITEIIDPPLAGLYSALGIGHARQRRFATLPLYRLLRELSAADCQFLLQESRLALAAELETLGFSPQEISLRTHLEMRYQGTDATIPVPFTDALEEMADRFHNLHQQYFGYQQPHRAIEICTVRLEAIGPSVPAENAKHDSWAEPLSELTTQLVWHQGKWINVRLVHRDQLSVGEIVAGPTIVLNHGHTTWIAPQWQASLDQQRNLRIQHLPQPSQNSDPAECHQPESQRADPIFRDLIGQRFAAIAQSMGEILEKTAISVNIKERRDFSCAIFHSDGYLIANAPHVPVHLGAMGQTVRELLQDYPDLAPDDCLVTNDPNRGGSHLPDVTVVTPVFDPTTAERLFFVACRAHHAEIGGMTAGSMPPTATSLEQEGVLLPPQFLIRHQKSNIGKILDQLTTAKYPSRSPQENVADLMAQQAANQHGVHQLIDLVIKFGKTRLQAAMAQIMDASALRVQRWIDTLPAEKLHFRDQLDDGSPIEVAILKRKCPSTGRSILCVDFSGTRPPHPQNFNANRAIVTAALLYVIRTLAGDELPLNEGAMRPIELRIPKSMLSPVEPSELKSLAKSQLPAVAAGNVETSQRIVDVLLGALGAAAASQGTMNNLLFGDSTFGYYETICGGTGATASGHGCDAVHSHMTNTRITDPEVLEVRYPVRLHEFSIRPNSGGAGEYRGGHGIVREIEFLRPLQATLITSRREGPPPYGLLGGGAGKLGLNQCFRADGTQETLRGTAQIQLQPGDRIRIETPGGGGYGRVKSQNLDETSK